MARIRLNNEYRTKIANRMRVHLEQEDTQEKRKYDKLKGDQIDINDQAWSVAEKKLSDDTILKMMLKKHIIFKISLKMFLLLQKIVVSIFIMRA